MELLIYAIPNSAFIDALNVMLLMAVLLSIDTITKWIVIVHKYNNDKDIPQSIWNTFRGIFFRAWIKGYLESGCFREQLGKKSEAYLIAVLLSIVIYLFPDYTYNGIRIDETLAVLILFAIVLAEAFSIAENLKEMGIGHIGLVERALKALLRKMGIDPEDRGENKRCDK